MCNEAARLRSLGEISAEFNDLKIRLVFPEGSPNLAATDSIRITDPAAIVRWHGGAHQLVQRRWSWPGPSPNAPPAGGGPGSGARAAASSGRPVYNYRSEGRRFVNSGTGGRCLIPLDGFYEFTAAEPPAKRKTKWLFTVAEPGAPRALFAVAGLWRRWRDDAAASAASDTASAGGSDFAARAGDAAAEAFTMLTCAPGPDIAPYHDRQIVLMPRAHWGAWLAGAEGLIAPTPAGTLTATRVG